MSMLTPLGKGARPLKRRGSSRSSGTRRRVAVVALALLVLVTLAVVAWESTNGDDDDVRSQARPTCPTPSPTPSAVAPGQVRVNVYNATDRRGLAARVAGEMKRRGFRVGGVDNDPAKRTVTGLAEVRHSPAGEAAARTVAAQVGQVVAVPDQRAGASVDLVLGAAFERLLTPADAAAELSPSSEPVPSGC
jgi:LytR cell envelope-related transcriptional attenuator